MALNGPSPTQNGPLLHQIKTILEKILPHVDYKNFLVDLEQIPDILDVDFEAESEDFADIFALLHEYDLFTSWLNLSTQLAFHQVFPEIKLILGTYFSHSDLISIFFKYPHLDDFLKNQHPERLQFFLEGYAKFEQFTLQESVGSVDPTLLFFARKLAARYSILKKYLDQLFPLWPEIILTDREDWKKLNFTRINLIFQINEEKEKIAVNLFASEKYRLKMEQFQTSYKRQLKNIMLHASHLAISTQIGSYTKSVYSLLNMKVFDDSFNSISFAIHGGAGSIASIPEDLWDTLKFSLFLIVVNTLETLVEKKNSLEAAETAVKALEDCFLFNAGKGAVFNCDGEHEMEATIMNGSNGKVGCVAGVKTLKNPVSAARKILEDCRHISLYGESVEEYCPDLERRDSEYFDTHIRYKQLENVRKEQEKGSSSDKAMLRHQQTVGAVVVDQRGNLAAATSTGGTVNKMKGRIGDSSVVGAGTFADQNVAVSTTGHGEEFLRRAIAARVAFMYEFSKTPDISDICKRIVDVDMKDKLAGLIAVDRNGRIGAETNAKMFFGSYRNGVITADIIGLEKSYRFVYKLF